MDKLKEIIEQKVFDNKKIKKILKNSSFNISNENAWIMNFKSVSVNREFLEIFVKEFDRLYEGQKIQVGGMESGSIPFLAALSLSSKVVINSFYIRKARKKSDLSNIYEGEILKDIKIVLIDDILNKGNTFVKCITILEELEYRVSEVFSIIKFRDEIYYRDIFRKDILIRSMFECNDFKESLDIENIKSKELEKVVFNNFNFNYKLTLTDYCANNFYGVIPKSGIVSDGRFIYTGADDGCFYCIEKENGEIKWKYKIAFGVQGKNIFSTPSISKKYVFFGAYDGNLYCLDKMTGKKSWIFYDADYIGASSWVDGEYVYIGLEFGLLKKKGGVAKINIETGKIVWANYEMYGLTHASPVSNTKLNIVICGCNDNFVYCFDIKNGNIIWKYETGGEVKYSCIFDEKRKLVVIASMDGDVYCLNTKDGSLYHKFDQALFGFYSTPSIYNDVIYIGSLDKNVYAFDLKNKSLKWKFKTFGRIFSSPFILDSNLFIGSNDGFLYIFDIDKKNNEPILISKIVISERIVNKIFAEIKNGKIEVYIKSFLNEVYKFTEK